MQKNSIAKVFLPDSLANATVHLSVCDAYSPKTWFTQTNFWPLRQRHHPERIFQLFQEGLRRTLAEIPALAGTIAHGSSGDPRDLVILLPRGAHVEFTCEDVASTTGIPSYAALKAQGFPMTDLLVPLSPQVTLEPVSAGAPLLAVKLNLLDGGFAVTFGFNHVFTDAGAAAEVLRIWAMHTADVSREKVQCHRPNLRDIEIRKRLSTPVPDAGTFENIHWSEFPTQQSQLDLPREAVSMEAAFSALQQAKLEKIDKTGAELEQTNWCVWYFSPEKLARLKEDASKVDKADWISTIDALIGLFWSRLAYIHQHHRKSDELSTILFPINIRQRLQPPIHPHYIGNAVDIVFTECSHSQLTKSSGLVTAARSIRTAIQAWSHSDWEAWLKKAVSLPAHTAICPNPQALAVTHNMAFNDYSKSQTNTLDWGTELGTSDRTRYMQAASSLANCATAVVVHPRLRDGGLEVAMTSNELTRRALESDDVFQKYGTLACIYA